METCNFHGFAGWRSFYSFSLFLWSFFFFSFLSILSRESLYPPPLYLRLFFFFPPSRVARNSFITEKGSSNMRIDREAIIPTIAGTSTKKRAEGKIRESFFWYRKRGRSGSGTEKKGRDPCPCLAYFPQWKAFSPWNTSPFPSVASLATQERMWMKP